MVGYFTPPPFVLSFRGRTSKDASEAKRLVKTNHAGKMVRQAHHQREEGG